MGGSDCTAESQQESVFAGRPAKLPVRHTVESRTTHKKKGGAPMYYPRANLSVPFAGHLIVSNCNI